MFWDCCLISKVWFKLKTNTLSKRVNIKLMEMELRWVPFKMKICRNIFLYNTYCLTDCYAFNSNRVAGTVMLNEKELVVVLRGLAR